jgi:hypothetical protein
MSYPQFSMKFKSSRIGQKAICIDDSFSGPQMFGDENKPVAGRTYTVREEVYMSGGAFLRFEELLNKKLDTEIGPFEPAYSEAKFMLSNPSDELSQSPEPEVSSSP